MILKIESTLPGFKPVMFKPGFNIVLADRTKESTKKDSRNGLGKSTLLEIIHFCLGSSLQQGDTLRASALASVSFSMEFILRGERVVVQRSTANPGRVFVEGDFRSWPNKPERGASGYWLSANDWRNVLAVRAFDIPTDSPRSYKPTFRSCISYLVRLGQDAYSEPFRHFGKQLTWDIQVNTAFLLGLAWEDASEWQELRDKAKILDSIKSAAQAGLMKDVLGSRGELEAEYIRLEATVNKIGADLKGFRVLSQYRELEARADEITRACHEFSNGNVTDQQLLDLYNSSLESEKEPAPDSVLAMYAAAGVSLPGAVLKRVEDVQHFHAQVLRNRKQFLLKEVDTLKATISGRETKIATLQKEHAEIMETLSSHGALDQFVKMQRAHSGDTAKLKEITARLDNIKRFEEGRSSLKIETEMLRQRARKNYADRYPQRQQAVAAFNEYSQALYKAPGNLVIDIGKSGFKFAVEIERASSTGVSNMKVFCYDLALAKLWSKLDAGPRFLVHDSTIFADVDERQVAAALEVAHSECQALGYQYICTFNSDNLPLTEFSKSFSIDRYVCLRLTDAKDDGGLLGIRF